MSLGGHRFTLWYAVLSGPFWWMVHITGVSALASGACGRPGYEWLAHGLTVVTALPVVVALAICRTLVRSNRDNVVGFLGWFGLFAGGLSLLLILFEEVYIWTVRVCG